MCSRWMHKLHLMDQVFNPLVMIIRLQIIRSSVIKAKDIRIFWFGRWKYTLIFPFTLIFCRRIAFKSKYGFRRAREHLWEIKSSSGGAITKLLQYKPPPKSQHLRSAFTWHRQCRFHTSYAYLKDNSVVRDYADEKVISSEWIQSPTVSQVRKAFEESQ